MTGPQNYNGGADGRFPAGYPEAATTLEDPFPGRLADLLELGAPPPDSAAGADWSSWSPDLQDYPSPLIRVGRSGLREPNPLVCFGGLGSHHTALVRGAESEELARQYALRLAGDTKHVEFVVCDFARTGAFAPFVGSSIARNVFPHEAEEVFMALDKQQHRIATTSDYRPGVPGVPWYVVLMTGEPPNRVAAECFSRLTESTNWGAIVSVGTRVPDWEHVQKGIGNRVDFRPDPPLPAARIRRELEGIAEASTIQPMTTYELLAASSERLPSSKGIEVRLGINPDGSIHRLFLDDSGAHMIVVGRTGSGKTNTLSQMLLDVMSSYSEDDVEAWVFDGKGADFTAFVPEGRDPANFPQLRVLGNNVEDPEDWAAIMQSLVGAMEDRYRQMRLANVNSIEALRARTGKPIPRILAVCDEIDKMLNNPMGKEILASLSLLANKARQAGIHLVLGTQTWKNIDLIHLRPGTFEQFTHRIVMKGEHDETVTASWIDERIMARARPRQAVINNRAIVTVPWVTFDDIEEFRNLASGSRPSPSETMIMDGLISPRLIESRPYQELHLRERGEPAVGLLGQMPGFDGRAGSFEFGLMPGRNVGVLGTRQEEVEQIMRSVTETIGVQHAAGDATFTILNHNPAYSSAVQGIAYELSGFGHEVNIHAGEQAHAALAEIAKQAETPGDGKKHYVVIFGADSAKNLGKLLDKCSERGTHVIAAATSLSRMQSAVGGYASVPELVLMMNGIVSVGIGQRELASLTGDAVNTHPTWQDVRPGRALFFDVVGNTGRHGKTLKTYE